MPDLEFRVRKAKDDARLVELTGLIDASTIEILEELLARLAQKRPTHVVFDFKKVVYVNSMGIAAFLNFREDLEQVGGTVAIAAPDREVAVTMRNLGLTELVPVYHRASAALLRKPLRQERVVQAAPRRRPAPPPPPGEEETGTAALLVSPQADHFTDVCRMRLSRASTSFDLAHTLEAARELLKRNGYGLLILEDRIPESEGFLAEVKTSVQHGLISVLKLYSRGHSPQEHADFKIWENDYLVEPFEVRELFVLAERELARLPGERRTTIQHSRLRFRTSGRNVNRAASFLENVIGQSTLDEHSAIKMMSAIKEGIDNAVRHGHKGSDQLTCDVVYLLRRDRVEVTIRDQGDGFDWRVFLEQARSGDAYKLARKARQSGRRGGLGIKIMYECTDSIRYSEKGNQLHLVKVIQG